jgi:hypothetical protein
MKKILFASSILGSVLLSSLALAQTPKTKVTVKPKTKAASVVAPYPTQNYPASPVVTGTVAATPAANPPPIPWKLVYFTEWVGPRFSNFDLAKTQGPLDGDLPDYTTIFHSLKIGYAVSNRVVLGGSLRGESVLDPKATNSFNFYNLRLYGSWKHMIDTSIVDMQQVVEAELPTTDSSRTKGLIVRFNIKNNWTIKTSLRNWYFSFTTLLSPRYYDAITGTSTDLAIGIFPWITLDLAPDWQLVFEGSFDAGHKYQETFFDFNQGDPDYVNVGFMWSLNSHFQLNPALRFYTVNLSPSRATAYLSLTAVL